MAQESYCCRMTAVPQRFFRNGHFHGEGVRKYAGSCLQGGMEEWRKHGHGRYQHGRVKSGDMETERYVVRGRPWAERAKLCRNVDECCAQWLRTNCQQRCLCGRKFCIRFPDRLG